MLNRRQMIKAIGATICAGSVPLFVKGFLPEEERFVIKSAWLECTLELPPKHFNCRCFVDDGLVSVDLELEAYKATEEEISISFL